MKRMLILTLGLALAGGFYGMTPEARADVAVSVGVQVHTVGDFVAPLTPHGVWVEVGTYGQCWQPKGVALGWRPYCSGTWTWTDCGWYWVTDEPWAWACYHYGSWYYDPGFGWVWVPGLEWAPAWVYWRIGGGYIGWAPCGPRGAVVTPGLFVFVGASHFDARVRPSTVIVNNTKVVSATREITTLKRETRAIAGRPSQVVVNEGPGVETVRQATRREYAALPVNEVDRRTSVPAGIKRRSLEPSTRTDSPAAVQPAQPPKAPGDRMFDTRPAPPQEPGYQPPDKKPAPQYPFGPPTKGERPRGQPAKPQPDDKPKGDMPDLAEARRVSSLAGLHMRRPRRRKVRKLVLRVSPPEPNSDDPARVEESPFLPPALELELACVSGPAEVGQHNRYPGAIIQMLRLDTLVRAPGVKLPISPFVVGAFDVPVGHTSSRSSA